MTRAPEVLLDRYLAGDLTPAVRRDLEARLAASPELRERLSRLRAERELFLAGEPPERFAQRLAARVSRDAHASSSRPRLFGLLLVPATAVTAAAVVLVLAVRSEEYLAPAVEAPPLTPLSESPMELSAAASAEKREAAPIPQGTAIASRSRSSEKAGKPARATELRGASGVGPKPVSAPPAREAEAPPAASQEGGMLAVLATAPAEPSPAAPSSAPAARAAPSVGEPRPERSPLVADLEVRGDLEPSAVASVIESRRAEIILAWQQARTAGSRSPAALELLLTITASGDVERTEPVVPAAGDPALDRALYRQIAAAARSWRFPPSPSGGSTVVRCTLARPR